MDYRVILSNRRTLGLQFIDGEVVVRAPYLVTSGQIDRFVQEHAAWIQTQLRKQAERQAAFASAKVMTPEQFARLKKLAHKIVPERIAYYAPRVGVSSRVSRVFIRCQRTKWGSCSANGNININCLLLLAPKEVLDSVVVHELCHLKYMNHSKQFYAEVRRVFPQYNKWNRWLKENGAMLQAMVPEGER